MNETEAVDPEEEIGEKDSNKDLLRFLQFMTAFLACFKRFQSSNCMGTEQRPQSQYRCNLKVDQAMCGICHLSGPGLISVLIKKLPKSDASVFQAKRTIRTYLGFVALIPLSSLCADLPSSIPACQTQGTQCTSNLI